MARSHKLKAHQIAAIKDAWVNGIDGNPTTALDLAVEYDVSAPAIIYHCRGLERRLAPPKGSPKRFDHDKARRLVAQGLSRHLVAKRLGVTAVSICRVVGPTGVKRQGRRFDIEEARRLLASGLSYRAAADRLGVTHATLWEAFREAA